MVEFTIDPRNTTLLGIDLQNCFVGKSPFAATGGLDLVVRTLSRLGHLNSPYCASRSEREAHARQFQVLFLSDGTATFDMPDGTGTTVKAEDAQRQKLATKAFGIAEVLSVEMAFAKLRR